MKENGQMRNLLEYPVTDDEVRDWLFAEACRLSMPADNGEFRVGDMRPLYIKYILEMMDKNG